MSKNRATLFLIAAMGLALALPAAAADGGAEAEVSWSDAIVELVGEVIDALLPDTSESNEEEDNLPGILPVIDPDG